MWPTGPRGIGGDGSFEAEKALGWIVIKGGPALFRQRFGHTGSGNGPRGMALGLDQGCLVLGVLLCESGNLGAGLLKVDAGVTEER